jgi:hypothetical protein
MPRAVSAVLSEKEGSFDDRLITTLAWAVCIRKAVGGIVTLIVLHTNLFGAYMMVQCCASYWRANEDQNGSRVEGGTHGSANDL